MGIGWALWRGGGGARVGHVFGKMVILLHLWGQGL